MNNLISFPTAKLAKEKGFDQCSPAFYGCDEPQDGVPNELNLMEWIKFSELGKLKSQEGTLVYHAPTQDMLRCWLRDTHKFHIDIKPDKSRQDTVIWYVQVYTLRSYDVSFKSFVYVTPLFMGETYEDALEIGLYKALELIKVNKTILKYECGICHRKFIRKMPHKCLGGMRKKRIIWIDIFKTNL
jgi:hypothetical protein